MSENPDFLTSQIITYIGNKRTLIYDIESQIHEICAVLGKEKIDSADLFSGSGIVARMLKQYSHTLTVNDMENYSYAINGCYLSNVSDFDEKKYEAYLSKITEKARNKPIEGLISKNYAPKDDSNIKKEERVFYTRENALAIDTYRNLIDEIVDEGFKKYFLAPLITEASVHVNTSGVFKGFYKDKTTGIGCFGGKGKNALSRIQGRIELKKPVLSRYESTIILHKEDTMALSKRLKNLDVAYLDPPYNQHPYGSNYFMLNLILKNRLETQTSSVSGIPIDWNRSVFNKRAFALKSIETIIENLDAKFIIVSYNSEGFISFEQMTKMLEKYGDLKTVTIKYNTFRGSRNLRGRAIHVSEYLFVLKKR